MSKVYQNSKEALDFIKPGLSLMSGGFGLCGIPENSIDQIVNSGANNLTVISNNIGNSGRGLAKLIQKNQISKAVCSYVGGNPDLEEAILNKSIEVELVPQGTFSERIRSAGIGIRGFFTPAGVETIVADGKEVRDFDVPCVFELPLKANLAIIKAQIGDEYGNLYFKETAQNFSPLMAMAAETTVVEVEELVKIGDLNPEHIHLPGIFVQRIYQGSNYKNEIEYEIVED